jgi:NhaP-type Na+/H+ or K+/H+ antiporter
VEVLFSLCLPYTAYLVSEKLGISGVLAVVAAGLVRSRAMAGMASPETRMASVNMWNVIVFLFNSLIFMMIGLALPRIVEELRRVHDNALYVYAIAIVCTAVVVRLLWVFPGATLMRAIMRRKRRKEEQGSWRQTLIIGWAGMRGILTIAAALALPHATASGDPFPHRLMIIFLAFAVVLSTLLLQGLSLGPMIAALGVGPDVETQREEEQARIQMAHAALAVVNGMAAEGALPALAVAHVRNIYAMRLEALGEGEVRAETGFPETVKLRLAALHAERTRMIELWRAGALGDEPRRELERELDLEEASIQCREGE